MNSAKGVLIKALKKHLGPLKPDWGDYEQRSDCCAAALEVLYRALPNDCCSQHRQAVMFACHFLVLYLGEHESDASFDAILDVAKDAYEHSASRKPSGNHPAHGHGVN